MKSWMLMDAQVMAVFKVLLSISAQQECYDLSLRLGPLLQLSMPFVSLRLLKCGPHGAASPNPSETEPAAEKGFFIYSDS